jgi:hypothetical protein
MAVRSRPKRLFDYLMAVAASGSAGLLLTALVADVIAADARFNNWVGTVAKRTYAQGSMVALVDWYCELCSACQAAAEEFGRTQDEEALRAVLTKALDELRKATPQESPGS